jgi:hypothetical protein
MSIAPSGPHSHEGIRISRLAALTASDLPMPLLDSSTANRLIVPRLLPVSKLTSGPERAGHRGQYAGEHGVRVGLALPRGLPDQLEHLAEPQNSSGSR